MNLAYKKILGKFTKVLGFGKTPPHVGKNSQIISFFLVEHVPNHLQIMINTRVLAHPANNLTFRWVFSKGEERADIEQVRGDLVG